MRQELQDIMEHFGMEHQKEKLKEECREYLESGDDEEIADVFLLAKQIHDNSAIIQYIARNKIRRTKKRIKENYYE